MKKFTLSALIAFSAFQSFSQLDKGSITGNLETTFQYLNEDSIIGATQPASKGLLNSYMNIFYTNGKIRAGVRFESYLPRIQGYPSNFDGTGLGMRYVGYNNDFIDITVGSIYEQFGSGLSLRAYEDRALGFDNMLDGIRLIVKPKKGMTLKGVYGYQRLGFIEGSIQHGEGIVRGIDGEIHVNEVVSKFKNSKLDITLGGSFVSKYQRDDNSAMILPENVGVYGGRLKLRYQKFTFEGEYVTKGQDPSEDNAYNYNIGHAAVFNLGYNQKGLGILVSAKSVDNMSYRSDRTKQLQNGLINFLPALTKTHTYNLVSSLYPYATQPVGEIAFQAEVMYTIKKGTLLGGKYGTSINANFSTAYRPMRHTSGINPMDSTGATYTSGLFDMSDSLYWSDFNISITKKFGKKFNLILNYYNQKLNNDVATVTKETGFINTSIFVVEAGYKLTPSQSVRAEFQTLFVNRRDANNKDLAFWESGKAVDKGDWMTYLIEYTFNSNWFVSVMDQYNFGNPDASHREHHPYVSLGYIREATRITFSYGRQRAGLFCVGGICRPVPASNGLTFSLTHSF